MAKQYKSLHPVKYYRDHLKHSVRPDGRDLDKFRPVIINSDSVSTADGSAVVKVGRTCVFCGIKAEFCTPKAEKPNEGFIVPNIELPPLCSPKFKTGPPGNQAQADSKLLAEIIENSTCIDLKDLCIVKEKLAWCLYIDLVCLDHDGSIIDACLLALSTALRTVLLPSVEFDPATDNKLVNINEKKPLKLYNIPVSTTFALFDDVVLIDPTAEEESLCIGAVTVITKDDDVVSVLKPGGSPMHSDKLLDCIKQSLSRAKLLTKLIQTATQESNDEPMK